MPSCSLCPATRPSSSCLIHFAGTSDPSEGDGEGGKPIVSDIPVWSFDEGLLVIEETGLGVLKAFFQLVDRRFVFRSFGPCLAEILLMAAVRSVNEGVDNGTEHGWVQVGGRDSISD